MSSTSKLQQEAENQTSTTGLPSQNCAQHCCTLSLFNLAKAASGVVVVAPA